MGGSHDHQKSGTGVAAGGYYPSRSHGSTLQFNSNASIASMTNTNNNPSIANMATSSSYPEQNFGVGNKWVKNLYKDRLDTFLGGHYDDVNLSHVLFTERVDSKDYVKLLVWSAPGREKPSFHDALKQADKDGWKEAKKGDSFGPSCECFTTPFRFDETRRAPLLILLLLR